MKNNILSNPIDLCLKPIIFLMLLIQIVHSSTSLDPAPFETTTVYYDPLRISTSRVSAPQFSCIRFGHQLINDSVTWSIDDKIPATAGIAISDMGSDIDTNTSKIINCGTCMHIDGQTAERLFAVGIHSVKLIARYADSSISATWFFKFKRVTYKQVMADVVIDSFNTDYNSQSGWLYSTKFRITSIFKMDTSIFCNTCNAEDTLINYDTSDISRQFTSHQYASRLFTDTLHCFVFQSNPEKGVSDEWSFSKPVSYFIRPNISNPPFALQDALNTFDLYLNEKSLPKTYGNLSRPIKLGPVIYFGAGDPGWNLTAHYDNSFWYLSHLVGSGDCPSGCTEWNRHDYKISKDGAVIDLALGLQLSRNFIVGARIVGSKVRYDLLGRHILKQTDGIFLEFQNRSAKKVMIYNRQHSHF